MNKVKKIIILILTASAFSVSAQKYSEAPMLDDLVKSGKLPAVEKRLPDNPCVVKALDKVGTYGGTAYIATLNGIGGFDDDLQFIGFEAPLFLTPAGQVVPNVIEKWEYSKDYKEVTLHIRKGIKWSDGVELTADDMMFFWNDELNNPDYNTSIYIDEFKGAKCEKVDQYSVKITFENPYPLFDLKLAKQWAYQGRWWRPAHFCKPYNSHYVDREKLLADSKKEGFSSIKDYYEKKVGRGPIPSEVNVPTLTAFVLTERTNSYWAWERNPYYFKVDQAGNQLPYIDKVVVKRVDDNEALQGMIISGQVDLSAWNTSLDNYPLYKKNEQAGKYNTYLWKSDQGADVKFMFNLNVKDKNLHDIFNNIKFREAMSLAVNRKEINKLLYFNKAVPRQFYLLPTSKCYDKKYEEYFAQYDLKEANKLLDEIGLNKKDADGFRLFSDGKRVEILLEYWPEEPTTKQPVSELMKGYWGKVGIKITLKPITRTLMVERTENNDFQMVNWHGAGIDDSDWMVGGVPPLPDTGMSYGPLWGKWIRKEKGGVKPDEQVLYMISAMDKMRSATNETDRIKYGKEAWKIFVEQTYEIGTVGLSPKPVIVSKRLHNVARSGVWGNTWLHPFQPEQFFISK